MPIGSGGTFTARLDTAASVLTIPAVGVAGNPDAILEVRVAIRTITVSVLTVTWGATSLVRDGFVSGTNCRVERWYCVGPPVGTNSVVITFTGGNTKAVGFATPRYGVDQVDPISTAVTATGNSTGPTVSIPVVDTPLSENLATDILAAQEATVTPVTATVVTQTQEGNDKTTGGPAGGNILGACGQRTPTANPTAMTWLLNTATFWAMAGSYWKPARERISFSLTQPATSVFGFNTISQEVIDLQNQVRVLRGQVDYLERKVRRPI